MKRSAVRKSLSLWGAGGAVLCLISLTVVLQSCSGSSQPPAPLTITSTALPNGVAGTQYSQTIQAAGGVAPYHWAVSAGTLPANLQLNPSSTNTATISGTPVTPVQADAFSVQVADSASQTAIQPYKVSILGVPDTLTLTPQTLGFNPQLVSTSSSTQTMTLSNSGSTAVAINSVVAAGTNAGDFSQTNTCASGIAPGANCTITVIFTPSQAGPRVAWITINDDTVGTPHTLGLNGIGLSSGANATLSATSLTFNGQQVGTTSPPLKLTLTNYGEAPLNIAGIAASGNFSESNTCGATLAPGANCPIDVSFSPATAGALTGMLSVNDDSAGSPQTVTLSGSGASSGTLVLNGLCQSSDLNYVCGAADDLAECPAGVVATTPATIQCLTNTEFVDNSRACSATTRRGTVHGWCGAVPARASSAKAARKSCNK